MPASAITKGTVCRTRKRKVRREKKNMKQNRRAGRCEGSLEREHVKANRRENFREDSYVIDSKPPKKRPLNSLIGGGEVALQNAIPGEYWG